MRTPTMIKDIIRGHYGSRGKSHRRALTQQRVAENEAKKRAQLLKEIESLMGAPYGSVPGVSMRQLRFMGHGTQPDSFEYSDTYGEEYG